MDVRILGPMQLWVTGQVVDLGPARQRTVLAALLVDLGTVVPTSTLIDRVWDGNPPKEVRSTLYSYVTRLRRVLARVAEQGEPPPALTYRNTGYVLEIPVEHVDLYRFRGLVDHARTLDDAAAAGVLERALALWRGQPLADLSGRWVAQSGEALAHEHLDAALRWALIQLRLGNPSSVATALRGLVPRYPHSEALIAALMKALYLDGRRAEALDCFAAARQRLAEELGTEPDPNLGQLHQAILRGDPLGPSWPRSQAASAGPVNPARDSEADTADITTATSTIDDARATIGDSAHVQAVVPAQLPPDVAGFAGREVELSRLDRLLSERDRQEAVAILAITGTAGVGKTALAVRWAHRVRDRYTDGQLYINLRGHAATPPVRPIDALASLLRALGVADDQVPADVDEAAGLYRSLLAGRRVLVMFDDAAAAQQIRPLLPATSGCLALATSRDALTGFVARDGAHRLKLDVLGADEAVALLSHLLGEDRVFAEPDAAQELARLCGYLPLAIRVAAANHTEWESLSAYAARLAAGNRLAALEVDGDEPTAVRAALHLSYAALPPPAQRMFRLIGLLASPDVTAPAAAALADLPVGEARRLLVRLDRAHLITQHAHGRYSCHDLLHLYAAELTDRRAGDADQPAALRRVHDHYLHTAFAAARLLNPHRPPIDLPAAERGSRPATIHDRDEALAWFTAEHGVLLATVRQAAARLDPHTWKLAWCMATFFEWQGHWRDLAASQQLSIDAARQLGDRPGQATAHRIMATACGRTGRYDDALTHYHQALDLTDPGDHARLASIHQGRAWILGLQDHHAMALDASEHALDHYRAAGDRSGQARTLNAVGWHHAQLEDFSQALVHCQQALAMNRRLGDAYGQAEALDSLGYAHRQLGHLEQAVHSYRLAVGLFREAGDRFLEADTLTHLGGVQLEAGDTAAALRTWGIALTILDELDHRDADAVRKAINDLGPSVELAGSSASAG